MSSYSMFFEIVIEFIEVSSPPLYDLKNLIKKIGFIFNKFLEYSENFKIF